MLSRKLIAQHRKWSLNPLNSSTPVMKFMPPKNYLEEYGKNMIKSLTTAAAAEAEDIVLSGVMMIMNALVELPFKFCALNLMRVPRFSPDELNLQSIVNRLSVVELHMQQVQEQTAHNSARLTVVEQDKGTGVPGGDPARL